MRAGDPHDVPRQLHRPTLPRSAPALGTCLALLRLIQAVFLALVVENRCLSYASPWNITPSLQVGMEETLDSVFPLLQIPSLWPEVWLLVIRLIFFIEFFLLSWSGTSFHARA